MDPVRVLTWNLQGWAGIDVPAVAGVIADAGVDVVALQEVQRGQCRRLAGVLGMQRRWAFKHFSLRSWPEGLAVLTPHRFVSTDTFVLRREPWWSWRRRIGIAAAIERGGARFVVIDVHLSAHDDDEHRGREAARTLDHARRTSPPAIIAGDLNDVPGQPGPHDLAAAGWIDCWSLDDLAGDGATNWTSGPRRGRPPTQRIDYVFAPPGSTVVDAAVPAAPDRRDWFAERSDHLPLTATLELP